MVPADVPQALMLCYIDFAPQNYILLLLFLVVGNIVVTGAADVAAALAGKQCWHVLCIELCMRCVCVCVVLCV